MKAKRQETHHAQLRAQILEHARAIVLSEGLPALSIRKITTAMEYSPGIIYHYFKDKNELVEALLIEGYSAILNGLRQARQDDEDPIGTIRVLLSTFVEVALKEQTLYRLFLLSDSPQILAKTSVLYKGVTQDSPTMAILKGHVQNGMDAGIFHPSDPELTAQVVWASVYGLIMKIITEKQLEESQQKALVDQQLNLLIRGLEKH